MARFAFSPLRRDDHIDAMAIGPASTAAAQGPHTPSTPVRPPSTSPSGDDARGASPSVAPVPAGFALFGSGPAGASASQFALFRSGPAGASASQFALFRSGPAGASGTSAGEFALFG